MIDKSESCDLCCGSGRVAVGPWGSRPPRVLCPDCNGTGAGSVRTAQQPAPIIDPKSIGCPACFVIAGKLCTVPTDTSRREVKWHHHARIDAAWKASR